MLFTVSTVSVYRRLAKFAIGMLALASMLFMTACCYIFGTCDPPPKIPLPTITLNPNSATVQVAGTFSFTAKSTDRGTSTDITTSATWSSSDTTVAKVSQGVVTGIAPGSMVTGLAFRLDGACRVATTGRTVNTRGTGDRSGSSFRGICNSRATKRSASSSFDVG